MLLDLQDTFQMMRPQSTVSPRSRQSETHRECLRFIRMSIAPL